MQDFLKELFTWICLQSDNAPFFLFFLLLLSGLCIPVSEDLIVILGGVIAAHCLDSENFPKFLFLMLWLGVIFSAWEAYWIGRLVGPKIFNLPFIQALVKPRQIKRAEELIAKYGIYSFIVGRFFPGGIRNALFITSGLTHMPFPLFIVRDLLAGSLTTSLLFSIGYLFGENFDDIFKDVKEIDEIGLTLALLLIVFLFLRYKLSKPN
jgi:membrane protein DedA with SNARE-associated domain